MPNKKSPLADEVPKKDPVIEIFAQRMKESREICGFSMKHAATEFGYKNTSYLSKIENGNLPAVKIDLLLMASKVYDVSTDFLLGRSNEWERDAHFAQEKSIEGWLLEQWQAQKAVELNAIRLLSNKIIVVEKGVKELIPLIGFCHQFFNKFISDEHDEQTLQEINPAKVAINSTYSKSMEVKQQFLRFSQEVAVIKKGNSRPLLELIGE